MTEAATEYKTDDAIAPADGLQLTPLEQMNLAVAAIAGWENIQEWNPNPKTRKPKRAFTGTNKKHPELGVHIPDYTRDLNAIVAVFTDCMGTLGCHFQLDFAPSEYYSPPSKPFLATGFGRHVYNESPAIALCKLLLELAPTLPKSEEVQVIDDDGDIDEPKVIEAIFGNR